MTGMTGVLHAELKHPVASFVLPGHLSKPHATPSVVTTKPATAWPSTCGTTERIAFDYLNAQRGTEGVSP